MCGSMVDIQSLTAVNRRGKKERNHSLIAFFPGQPGKPAPEW